MASKDKRKNPSIIPYSLLILAGTVVGCSGIPWIVWSSISIISCSLILIKPNSRMVIPVSTLILMSTWTALNKQTFEARDFMVYTGYDTGPILVHIEGRIIGIQTTRIDLELRHVFEDDMRIPVTGRIVVRLPMTSELFGEGDILTIKGWVHGIQAPRESEPNWRSIAINGDYRGWMKLESMDLIHTTEVKDPAILDSLNSYAEGKLLSQPVPEHVSARTLLAGLLLGMRGDSWNEVSRPFRKTGVSHLLAISRLHVSLVLFMFMPLIGIGGFRRRWHSLFAIVILFTYMSIIEIRTPIMRAGIMSAFFYIPFAFYRRIPVKGVLAFTTSLLLVCEPSVLSKVSFQLSFGVVAALVLLAPHVHRRYFPETNTRQSGLYTFVSTWIWRSVSASTVAWLISIPITIHHFGQTSLLAVPMTLVMTPIVCVILCTASFRLLMGQIGFIDQSMGHLLVEEIHVLESFSDSMANLPFMSFDGVQAGSAWTILGVLWVIAWCVVERRRFLLIPSLIMLITWILIANNSG